MKRMAEQAFFALLRYDVAGAELPEAVRETITESLLPALFSLSKKQDLAHLIGDALEKNGLLQESSEAHKRFSKERDISLYRQKQQEYALEKICELLEGEKIPFTPLKGSVIRDYYPERWMRTGCDVDILVSKDDIPRAVEALKIRLSYNEGARGDHDVSLVSPSGVHLELHFSLAASDKRWQELLENPETAARDGGQYRRAMTPEMLLFYHIVHMAVHMRTGGCGVKPFVDLWVMSEKISCDKGALDRLLSAGGLSDFAEAARALSVAWMTGGEMSDICAELADFVLSGGVFGTLENRVTVAGAKRGGRLSFLLSRAFIGFDEMALKYPSVRKRALLFPLYQVYRWFDLLINKKSREYTRATIKRSGAISGERAQRLEGLFKKLGI